MWIRLLSGSLINLDCAEAIDIDLDSKSKMHEVRCVASVEEQAYIPLFSHKSRERCDRVLELIGNNLATGGEFLDLEAIEDYGDEDDD